VEAEQEIVASPSERAGAHGLPAEVLAGLAAVGRVSRALVGAGTLSELSERALGEMREALDLDVAVLYLPAAEGVHKLRRYVTSTSATTATWALDEVSFDEEAWGLAVASGLPLLFHEQGSWLGANPFAPPALSWLVLPLVSGGVTLGVVAAASGEPLALDPVSANVLALLGDLLTAGIATARLRQEVQRTEIERERMRLAAEVHDGLAQDLALASRELRVLDADLPEDQREQSWMRLREAIASAHRVVRARLVDLTVSVPLGGIGPGIQQICAGFAKRGMPVQFTVSGPALDVPPDRTAVAVRVVTEALSNAERHAGASSVRVALAIEDEHLTVEVTDDGRGFAPDATGGPGEGHFGLTLMRERAQAMHATLEIDSAAGTGTRVRLRMRITPG
jgi:signal transduction histidine kinase